MADVETCTLPIKQFLASEDVTPSLAKRIQAADVNGDGHLSISEVMAVLTSEAKAIKDKKLLTRIVIALMVAILILVATICGTTYAIVSLTKEVNDDNGMLVSKNTGQPMSTGLVTAETNLTNLWQLTDPAALYTVQHIFIPDSEGITLHGVSSARLIPNTSVTIKTFDGEVFFIDPSGVYNATHDATDNLEGGGRRRLQGPIAEFIDPAFLALQTIVNPSSILNSLYSVGPATPAPRKLGDRGLVKKQV